ncbi:hypothetical protein SADUNF_Sadunf13G0074800 [Salix dunnii]|uniref:Uncharacterized protein n=1 Tax=Salix dunnii TaxID=1413687 RepID=A0A835MUX1_9ROSI|nr:hypothetical protein SADUNF_Sadunf13G0074800 [Salix dunnii]
MVVGGFQCWRDWAVSIETCEYFAKYGRGYLPSLLPLLEIEPARSSGAESSAIDVACSVVLLPLHILSWIIRGLLVSNSSTRIMAALLLAQAMSFSSFIAACEPFKETFRRDLKCGGFKIVEMLLRCNILALVVVDANSQYPPNF